jgi:hypothetical protein
LEALIDSQFAAVIAVDGNSIMQIDHPIVVKSSQLVEHFGCSVHIFLKANYYQFCHARSPFGVVPI